MFLQKLILFLVTILSPVVATQEKGLPRRKFVHTKEELLLTELVGSEINHTGCEGNSSPDIVIIVHSSAHSRGKYYQRRQLTRETWGRDAKQFNIPVIFAMGLPKNAQVQAQLVQESSKFRDMLQFKFVDGYFNLTLKAIAVTRWLRKYCSAVKLIGKADDDVLVNVRRLMKMKDSFKSGITGHLISTYANREISSRYYMPESVYPDKWYPYYVSGLFYVMTQDALVAVSTAASIWSELVLDFDDLYLTGIVGDLVGVDRMDSPYIMHLPLSEDGGCGIGVEELSRLIAFHGCPFTDSLRKLYLAWKEELMNEAPEASLGSSNSKVVILAFLAWCCIYAYQVM
jgi:hypothetical protein